MKFQLKLKLKIEISIEENNFNWKLKVEISIEEYNFNWKLKNVISIEFNFQIGHVWLKELNLIEIHKMIWSYECVFDKKYFD